MSVILSDCEPCSARSSLFNGDQQWLPKGHLTVRTRSMQTTRLTTTWISFSQTNDCWLQHDQITKTCSSKYSKTRANLISTFKMGPCLSSSLRYSGDASTDGMSSLGNTGAVCYCDRQRSQSRPSNSQHCTTREFSTRDPSLTYCRAYGYRQRPESLTVPSPFSSTSCLTKSAMWIQ